MIPPIGFANQEDLCKLTELYSICFPEDPPAFWQWFFEKTFDGENILVLRCSGEIVSSLQMLPCAVLHSGKRESAHYIYAACTAPSARGKGWMGALLSEAAAIGRARGQKYSVLITREDSLLRFYDRYGYSVPALVSQYKAEQKALFPGETVRRVTSQDIPAMDEIYRREGSTLLLTERSADLWRNHLELYPDGAFLLENQDTVKAYCFIDDRGVLEAAGDGKARLVSAICPPGTVWRTLPNENAVPMGCLRPLTKDAQTDAKSAPFYLNLMYN